MAMPLVDWKRIDSDHYQAKYPSGQFDAHRVKGEWTLWFTANYTRGAILKPGSWAALATAKRRAKVLDNDHFLQRSS